MYPNNMFNGLTLRQQQQVSTLPRAQAAVLAQQYRQQNNNARFGVNTNINPLFRVGLNRRLQNQLPFNPTIRNLPFTTNVRNRILNQNPGFIPRVTRPGIVAPINRFRQGNVAVFGNGGMLNPSVAVSTDLAAPQAIGFSLSNSGERNVTFSKEFVAGFLEVSQTDPSMVVLEVSTHPSVNGTVNHLTQIYQRYKILTYQFKYKATCATTTTGMHFTGVDYGDQSKLPTDIKEAETLEHFSVGPIWQDSQNWHVLKMSNLKERWFSTNKNSSDPESRPARIIFGSMGAMGPLVGTKALLGVLEVKVTYLFNGLASTFTGEPPSKIENTLQAVASEQSSVSEFVYE